LGGSYFPVNVAVEGKKYRKIISEMNALVKGVDRTDRVGV
jgi:hypothetical protein